MNNNTFVKTEVTVVTSVVTAVVKVSYDKITFLEDDLSNENKKAGVVHTVSKHRQGIGTCRYILKEDTLE
jgi:hypothetical protein